VADPVTGELYSERFNFGLDGQRGQVVGWLAQAGVEQPAAEVAHLEAVLLDFVAELTKTSLWGGPDGQCEDFDRGWIAGCEDVQATLRKRLEQVLAARRHLALHEGKGGGSR